MCRHGKGEQRQDYPFSRVAPGVRPSLPGLHSFLRAFRRSPLGVWFSGLKEEIAGGQGPRRASQRPHE
eukprot:scaffold34786_cov55-Phaeocystis_antarctica.AAC.3